MHLHLLLPTNKEIIEIAIVAVAIAVIAVVDQRKR